MSATGMNININTDEVISTVKGDVKPETENIRDYTNKIPNIVDKLAYACQCPATAAAVDSMAAFKNKVAQHIDNLDKTSANMVDIAQTHADLDAKFAQKGYH